MLLFYSNLIIFKDKNSYICVFCGDWKVSKLWRNVCKKLVQYPLSRDNCSYNVYTCDYVINLLHFYSNFIFFCNLLHFYTNIIFLCHLLYFYTNIIFFCKLTLMFFEWRRLKSNEQMDKRVSTPMLMCNLATNSLHYMYIMNTCM